MNEKDVPTVKKLMNVIEKEGKRRYSKDLQSGLLYRVNRQHHQDVNIEFFQCLEDIRQIKSGLSIHLDDPDIKLTDDERKKGEMIVKGITTLLQTSIDPPIPKIESSGEKYRFKDGSESRFEDYDNVKATVREDALFNRILKLNDLFSDGLAFLGRRDKNLWHKKRDFKINILSIGEIAIGEDNGS